MSQLASIDVKPRVSAHIQVLTVLALALLAAMVLALLVGKFPLTLTELYQVLVARLSGEPLLGSADTVIWQLRLPRILAAILVGASLAVAGAAYQGMFRNPLVSPDILGVSAGAGLGAIAAIFFNLPMFLVQLCAFVGGLFAVAAVYALASLVRRHSGLSLGAGRDCSRCFVGRRNFFIKNLG